jgi:phosphoglucosamine mutase
MNTSLFGTDGIRTRVGSYPLTHEALPALSRALARFIQEKYGDHARVLIAHDTRQSCAYIKAHLKAGLLSFPITSYDAGILPTPAAHKLIHNSPDFACALIISASHNLYHDNGIKIIDAKQGKLSNTDEATIAAYMHEPLQPLYDKLGNDISFLQAEEEYSTYIQTVFSELSLQKLTIVLDCGYGATYRLAPQIFKKLGARVITVHDQPNGYNINEQAGALHPEHLLQKVLEYKADIGFAFDGDGDRLTVVTCSGHIKDGDAQLALLLKHPAYQHEQHIVSTIMANQALEVHAKNSGKTLVRTPVGDKYVAQAMHTHNALIGGEPSGHIILRDFIPSSDAIFAALRITETMLYTGDKELNTFTPYPQVLINMPIKHKKDLNAEPFNSLIAHTKNQLINGRVIVRYSGTESLLRVLVEDAEHEKAHMLGTVLAQKLAVELS